MIDVKLGVPVGEPLIFYHKEIKCKVIDSDKLKEFIKETKKDLDEACKKIDDSVSMASFYLSFLDLKNKKDLEFMSSTTDLTVFDSIERGVFWIKKYYERGFERCLEEIENREYNLDICVDFVGFRDKITQVVKAFEPPNIHHSLY